MARTLSEPRIPMSGAGMFLVRLVSYSWYTVLVGMTIIFLLSDITHLKWVGLLIAFFLADRIIHAKEGDRLVQELREYEVKGGDINLGRALSPSTIAVLHLSMRKSLALNHNFYLVLLSQLLQRDGVKETFQRVSASKEELLTLIEEHQEETTHTKEEVLGKIKTLVEIAYEVAINTNEEYIKPRNILVALIAAPDTHTKKIFEILNITEVDLQEAIIFGRYRPAFKKVRRTPTSLGGFAQQKSHFIRERVMNRSWTARPTPFLDQFSTDLTALARAEKVGLLIGHQKEYDHLIRSLSQPDKPNALLVGAPGVGKSTLISHLAFRIIKDDVPKNLFDKRLIQVDIGSLIANAPVEELAGRLKRIAEEIVTAGNIVLFVPDIHNLFKVSGEDNTISPIDVFLPIVQNSDIAIIGDTYPKEYKDFISSRSAFVEQFEVIQVEEVTEEEALRILIYHALILEPQYNIFITVPAIRKAVYLAYRYFRQRPLPSSALDLLKQSLIKAQQQGEDVLTVNMVVGMAQELSKVPVHQAEGAEVEQLLNLESIIHKRLINQNAAVSAVSQALREYRSGLSKEGKPIATFLFVGPTGVGKTELSKILARIQFGSSDAMVRLDMSEYQEKQSINRLLGDSRGDRAGSLTEAVLEQPYTLLLLDEFEKAHPDILNVFLQVFDDGRLTDNLGRTVSFANTIIIATSNAHSEFIKEEIEEGKTVEDIAEELKKKLVSFFKPELLNRFSDIIVFRNLNQKEIEQIAVIMLNELAGILEETHGMTLEFTDTAVAKIAELGFSPVFGARPLRAAISKHIRSVLAEKILRREIGRGNSIRIDHDGTSFTFSLTA